MKISRLLLSAAAAAIAAAVAAESSESITLTAINNRVAVSLAKRGFKDLELSYTRHCAEQVHHGTPGITLRFHSTAAFERSFILTTSSHMTARVQKEFTVQPGGTAEFTVFYPVANELGSSESGAYGVYLLETTAQRPDADSIARSIHDFQFCQFTSASESDPSVLFSQRIVADRLADDLSLALVASKYTQRHKERHYYGSTKAQPERYQLSGCQFKFPASDWPGDWRCYSTYDAIFVTEAEYADLNPGAKSALDVYRKLGGAVIVTKGAQGFAETREAQQALKAIDDSCDALGRDLNFARYYYISASTTSLTQDLRWIPIKAKSTISVKALLAVLAVFALAIVPVVIFRSVRRNARMRLLVLLPGSAALFAVVIAGFALAFFGTTPSVRLQSVTILDQTTKQAITRGQFAVFSPVSIDGMISFPLDTAFMRRKTFDNGSVTVVMSDAQHLNGRWVTPLVSAFFDFERVCERSERLDFRVSPSGDVKVVNLLGERVVWGQANVGGTLWTFSDVPAGGEVAAKRAGQARPAAQRADHPFSAKTSYGRDWDACIEAANSAAAGIPPGEYIAEVDGSPFFANPVSKKTDTSAAGLVYGKFREVSE